MSRQGKNQFSGHHLCVSGLIEGKVEIVDQLFRRQGQQRKPGSDAASQRQQFGGSEPLWQSIIAAQDGKQQALGVEVMALQQAQFGKAIGGDLLIKRQGLLLCEITSITAP